MKRLLVFVGLLVLLAPTPGWSDVKPKIGDDIFTALIGLDMSRVHFNLRLGGMGPPPDYAQFYAKAIDRLKKAGIYKEEIDPTTSLTLELHGWEGAAPPGQIIYEASLRLSEPAILERTKEPVTAVTWNLSQGPYMRTAPVPIDELERTMNDYLDQFIMSYKVSNQPKK